MKSLSAVTLARILCVLGGFAVAGVAFALWLGGTLAGQPDPRTTYNAFYVLFARDECLGLGLVAIFSFGGASWFFFALKKIAVADALPQTPAEPHAPALQPRLLIALIAAAVFAVAALGTELVCHDYPLSADEFLADFQAQIFLRGSVTAEVPAKWLPALRVIKPTYVDYLPQMHAWKATYLPVFAAMRAIFQSVHLGALLNPFLAALTILALYATARNIWPNEKQNAVVAVLLLATSAQFLVIAMTSYAMSAHLALNTIWLWLYSRPDRRRFYLAPLLGILAIGLHEPIVHALFVAPFLFRLVLDRKWRAVVIFAILYSLGCAGWYAWRSHYLAPPIPGEGVTSIFRLFNPRMIVIQPMDLLLLIGWSCLATPLLTVLGLRRVLRARSIVRDAALSCLLSFGFYYFFFFDQGYGWGYRYFHGTLSCLVLVAVAGWQSLGEKVGARTAQTFLGVSVAVSLFLALPLRCYQVESFVRPFARASEMIHSSEVEVVGVRVQDAWYSSDLVRNDPFLENRPIIAAAIPGRMKPGEVDALAHAGRTRFITKKDFESVGLTIEGKALPPDPLGLAYPLK